MASLPVPSVSDRTRKRKEEEKSRDVTGDEARYVIRVYKYSKVNVAVSKYGCTDVQHVCMLLYVIDKGQLLCIIVLHRNYN